jgi:hypothetical protein
MFKGIFDAEILTYFFSNKRSSRRFAGHCWNETPVRVRECCLQFRTTQDGAKSGLWTHLFVPVFERQLAKLGFGLSDREARNVKLEVLLQLQNTTTGSLAGLLLTAEARFQRRRHSI